MLSSHVLAKNFAKNVQTTETALRVIEGRSAVTYFVCFSCYIHD